METEPCPYCKEVIKIHKYGRKIPCPKYGGLLDIFPDVDLWLDTLFGKVGVSTEQILAILPFLKGMHG